jgi:hypothetical protein
MEEEKRKVGRPKGSVSKRLRLKKKNKELLLKSLQENLGILAPALKVANMNRNTFSKYYEEDLIFRNLVDEIREEAVDYVEGQLFRQIKNGGASQTIFYLKTKGKHRGYIEQNDTNMTIDAVKIKYIIPKDDNLIETNTPLPLDNKVITLNLPENK